MLALLLLLKHSLKQHSVKKQNSLYWGGLVPATVASLRNSKEKSGIFTQVIVHETTTSGQHIISTSHMCKCICSNKNWGKERFSFHVKFQLFGSESLQELLRILQFLGPWGRLQLCMGWVVRKTIRVSTDIHQNNQTKSSKMSDFQQTDRDSRVFQNSSGLQPYTVDMRDTIV